MLRLLLCHQEKKFPPHDLCLPIQSYNSWHIAHPTYHYVESAVLFKQASPVFRISQASTYFTPAK